MSKEQSGLRMSSDRHHSMMGKKHNKKLWLDLRAQLFLILICVLSSMFSPSLVYQFILVLLIVLSGLLFGKWRYSVKAVCFYTVICVLTAWIMKEMTGTLWMMFVAFLGLFHKVYACGIENPNPRTCLVQIKCGVADWVGMGVAVAFFALELCAGRCYRLIELENVSFTYQGQEHDGLREINLQIADGECVLFCGRSGCGKTTITRLVNGLIPQFYQGEFQGRILVDGQEI